MEECGTSIQPGGILSVRIPQVPNLTKAIGPFSTNLASLTKKSVLEMPIPIATIDTGTP